MRERLRAGTCLRILEALLRVLEAREIPVVVLKGMAVAQIVYSEPFHRHCHDVDLLVSPAHLDPATEAARSVGFALTESHGLAPNDRILEHESGLPACFHSKLFANGYYALTVARHPPRLSTFRVGDAEAHALCAVDTLVHCLGHAAASASRTKLSWVCDALMLIHYASEMNWDGLCDRASQWRLTLPSWVLLRYLQRELDAAIPPAALDRLQNEAKRPDRVAREVSLVGGLRDPRIGVGGLLRSATTARSRRAVIRWLLAPSAGFLRSHYGESRAWPAYYVLRPLRFLSRFLSQLLRAMFSRWGPGRLRRPD
jgi:hypothetical protein